MVTEEVNPHTEGRPSDEKSKMSTFEDLLELAGTRGTWNIIMFCMCSISSFISPLQMLSYQFLGATPDYWCSVEPLREANWTQDQVLSFAIPFSNSTGQHETCLMYDYNYTAAAEMGYDAAMANRPSLAGDSDDPIKCYSRDFNRTQYQSTVVTEWDLVCERRVLYSTTQSVVMGGKLVGYVVFGYLIDLLGRRPIVLVCFFFFILSSFLAAASPSVEVYILLKGILSLMESGQYLGLFVFVMETTATRYRAAVGTLFVIPWALGYMLVPGIAYLLPTWKIMQTAYSIPALWGIVYFVWLPESPRWLIMQGRNKEALKVLTQVAKVNKKTLPPDDQMISAMTLIGNKPASKKEDKKSSVWSRISSTLKGFFMLLILREFRVRTLVVFFCWFSVSMVYYGVALNADNINTNPYLYVFLGGLLEVPSYLLLWPALIFIGRRKSMVAVFLIGAVCIFMVMALMLLESENVQWAVVTLSQSGKVAVTAAFQLVWMYTAELYPTKFRSLAVGQSSMFARVGSVCSPYINDLMGATIAWGPSALFGSVSLMSAALTLLLPETRHLDLTEPEEKQEEVERFELKDHNAERNATEGVTNLSYTLEE
ncbi:organic cation transporter protein-like isoform X2 [Eriocheir sinensis]|nr:organic cation transporter protein-like isoform X2 [Eriocheir sinensis]XP_050727694.1 organic cation transporter protein-like isoform X2 [Eriocheir sinensis]